MFHDGFFTGTTWKWMTRRLRAAVVLCSFQDFDKLQKTGPILMHSAGNCCVTTSSYRESFVQLREGLTTSSKHNTDITSISAAVGGWNWSPWFPYCTIYLTPLCCSLILRDWHHEIRVWTARRNIVSETTCLDRIFLFAVSKHCQCFLDSVCVLTWTLCLCALLCVGVGFIYRYR